MGRRIRRSRLKGNAMDFGIMAGEDVWFMDKSNFTGPVKGTVMEVNEVFVTEIGRWIVCLGVRLPGEPGDPPKELIKVYPHQVYGISDEPPEGHTEGVPNRDPLEHLAARRFPDDATSPAWSHEEVAHKLGLTREETDSPGMMDNVRIDAAMLGLGWYRNEDGKWVNENAPKMKSD